MSPRIDDRWLWLGLGVFTFFAAKGVSYGLRHIVTLTTIHKPAPTAPSIPILRLGKEDAIDAASLYILATCDNIEIRKAATKILCERFSNNRPCVNRLLKELGSRDPNVQRRAKLALRLLCDFGAVEPGVDMEIDLDGGAHVPRRVQQLVAGRNAQRTLGMDRSNGLRGLGGHEDEVDLRRRRREAVVINDGDRPLSREDVYMRDAEGRMGTEEQVRGPSFPPGTEAEEAMRLARQHAVDVITAENDEVVNQVEGTSTD